MLRRRGVLQEERNVLLHGIVEKQVLLFHVNYREAADINRRFIAVIGRVPKRAEVCVDLAGQRNILELPDCGYYSVNASLFQVGSRMLVW